MKGPVHVKCARSGDLCEECKKKMDSGKISQLDVDVTVALSKTESKHGIPEVNFVKAYKIGSTVYILVLSNVSYLIGKNATILKELKKMLDAKIRIINGKSQRTIVKDAVYPVTPKYISHVFKPNGEEIHIIVPKNSYSSLPSRKELIEEFLKLIFGKKVSILEE